MLKGADISSYQETPNFDTLKTELDFVIIKASEGNGFGDPQLSRNQDEARRVGLLRGYYHFARPDLGNTPESEANWFLAVVGQLQDGEVLALDFEVTYTDAVNWCKAFLDYVSSKTGCKPVIYLNQSQLLDFNWKPVIDGDYGLWLARYDNDPNSLNVLTPWQTVAFKQYSSTGQLQGITSNVDLDTFFGLDIAIFKAYGYKAAIPAPQPAPPSTPPTDQAGDEKRALQALKDHILTSTDQNNQPFGNLEGYANTLTQDAYNAWKHPQVVASPPVVTVITADPVFHNPIAKWLFARAKELG